MDRSVSRGLSMAMGLRNVLFASWPVDPSVVDAHLPEELQVDTYDGRAWLSAVPLLTAGVRPRGAPERVGARIPELNFRTYVTCDGVPGVYFLSIDAQSVLGVLGARLVHHLPYHYARISVRGVNDRVHFDSKRLQPGDRPAHFTTSYRPVEERFGADPGSRAHFLTERYRYFTQDPSERIRVAELDHDRWPLYHAVADVDVNTLFTAAGFAEPDTEPVLYYSPGVDAVVTGSRRWG
jgi:hypothetical protein